MGSTRKFNGQRLRSTPIHHEGAKILLFDPARRISRKPSPIMPKGPEVPPPVASTIRELISNVIAFLFGAPKPHRHRWRPGKGQPPGQRSA